MVKPTPSIPTKGFTLVELLLYLSIAASVLLSISVLLSALLQSRVKNQVIAEVNQQGIQALQTLTQLVRNAESITSPAQGVSASSLTLDVVTASKDPTLSDLTSDKIRIKEGTNPYVDLTTSSVTASGLSFYNLSATSTPGTLRIQFTLTYVNPTGRNEYTYSKTFYATATLRQP